MRIGLVAVISSLAVALALVLGFVIGYGPYTFHPARLSSDVVAAMPAEKRAEWQTPHRIRGLDALREVSADPPMQAILREVTIVLWLSGFLSVLSASRWLRR